MTNWEEKRYYKRYNAALPVDIICTKTKALISHGITRNISFGGLSIVIEKEIDGTPNYIFELTSPKGKKVSLTGTISWKHPEYQKMSYGVQFHNLGFFKTISFKSFIDDITKMNG
ncbi:MAG: PilZ domain-containing protein [Elusimicrobiota bacterium]